MKKVIENLEDEIKILDLNCTNTLKVVTSCEITIKTCNETKKKSRIHIKETIKKIKKLKDLLDFCKLRDSKNIETRGKK